MLYPMENVPMSHFFHIAALTIARRPDPRLPSARDCTILSKVSGTEWHKNAAARSIKYYEIECVCVFRVVMGFFVPYYSHKV